jgi:polysaccharide biosynthesis protein PslA
MDAVERSQYSGGVRMQTMQQDATVPLASVRRVARRHPATGRASQALIADRFADGGEASKVVHSRAKRAFDIFVAALGLLLLLPALLAIAIAIKATSRGPILFRQQRYGLSNKLFVIFKFRTMYIDKGDQTGVKQTCRSDERVTPIGQFLRRYSLDELPQLLNIVKGDMSLVGPRPHVPGMLAGGLPYEALVPNYLERHRVRPGLTGLAQAQGLRGSTVDTDLARARIEQDFKYIQSWSLGLDLRIMIETVRTELLASVNGI